MSGGGCSPQGARSAPDAALSVAVQRVGVLLQSLLPLVRSLEPAPEMLVVAHQHRQRVAACRQKHSIVPQPDRADGARLCEHYPCAWCKKGCNAALMLSGVALVVLTWAGGGQVLRKVLYMLVVPAQQEVRLSTHTVSSSIAIPNINTHGAQQSQPRLAFSPSF